jgi:hypothetical protein
LPALVNAEAIQNLTNVQATAYLNFYQIHDIGRRVAEKKKAIGRAIGLSPNIVDSLQ